MVKRILTAAAVLLAGAAYAQPTPLRIPPKYTVATAPACVDGEPKLFAVTDGSSSTDCTVGGGSTEVICKCTDGTAAAVASGGGASNSFETINAPAGTDPVADSATDTLNITCAGGLTCTGTAATDTLDFTMGTATAATALAANGANCSAGQFPLGVDASGAVESCSTSLSGNADTATALAANPADCAANQFANAIAASGNLTCAAISDADVPDGITVTLAGTATALAANGANCSAGQYPLGVDASGAVESCTADDDLPDADEVTESMLKAVNTPTDEYLLTYESTTGDFEWAQHAPTASALAANGANCSAGQYPLGVDASGAVESCTADDDLPDADEITESMLKAVDTASDEECLTYETTTGDFEWQSCGSAGLGGTTGSTDDAILIADGTGGSTVAASAATLTAAGSLTIPNGQVLTFGTRARIGASGTDRIDIYDSAGATGSSGVGSNRFVAHDASFYLGTTYLAGKSGFTIQWSDSSTTWSANLKLALTRAADGVLRVTDGANGTLGIGAILSSVLVEANTAGSGTPNAIAATESGTLFTNEGATAENYESLPAAAAGYKIEGCVQDADGMRFTAGSGDTIRVLDKVTAAAGYISSTTIGSCVTLKSLNATEWFATSIHGVWTDGTFTYDDTGNTTP